MMTENEKKELEESISETVDEMKKKIEEITKEADEIEDSSLALKAKELVDKVSDTFNKTSLKLQDSFNQAKDSEQVKKTIDYVRSKTKEIGDYTSQRLTELKNNVSNNVKTNTDKTVAMAKDTALQVGKLVNKGIDNIYDENGPVKKVFDKVADVNDSFKENVNEFAAKNELDAKIEQAKDKTIEVAEKGLDALKRWLKPELYKEDKKDSERD